ncbi:trimeric intracellular cation channel family protein [Helcococcus kunzii]|uniref:Glycine transporter domain-containing protein n=1 Tax=Helcococcus kunzii ATCC 51366 TaxID=883114 RepID=H3NMK0_9FIRM|nr:trimeric intracellular cation channel family protein [Helcococcus kunzii]EHR35034.1 hypothetical protein HMPREF9709_00561 [Helcococcus kunzii ATCC 51366]MCT1796748.1 trimeric intracellular cation channel family protein [Helcococcus kunzii]MCT1988864.1 trimeric intracellular cation channel family protein [Helcococcus kunzii]QUY64509.1 trimeric intracellular cation channel family protein [Helcococcus kunzii]
MSNYILYIEVLGTVAFALSGAMEGMKKNLDILGVLILGVVTATGGGVIRDLTIGINPPLTFRSGTNIYISLITSATIFILSFFNENVNKRTVNKIFERALIYSDAIGLGVFTITGMQIAYHINNNHSLILYIFVGLISGVGGGIIRDLLIDSVPYILNKHVYASASIVGGLFFHLFKKVNIIPEQISIPLCIVIIIAIRIVAYHKKWNLPKATVIIE